MPEGWAEARLNQALQSLESGARPKGGVRGIVDGVPSIGGEHLNDEGGFRFDNVKFVPYEFFRQMRRGHINPGDILVVKDGATTGKVALVRDNFPYDPAVVNEHVFRCQPKPWARSEFLFHFLWSDQGQRRLLENFRGSAQGGFNQSFARGTAVPIAPTAEQERIVAKVEALLPRIKAVDDRLRRVESIVHRFRQTILAAACSGGLTVDWREDHRDVEPVALFLERIERVRKVQSHTRGRAHRPEVVELGPSLLPEVPDSWAWIPFDVLIASIRSGSTEVPVDERTDFPILRSSSVRPGIVDLMDARFLSAEQSRNPENYVSDGDMLFTRLSGSLQYVANCALVRELDGRRIQYPDRLFCAKLIEPRCAEYCELCFRSPVLRQFITVESRSSAGHQRISTGAVTGYPIPLPPTEERHEIVRRVEALFRLADAIETRVAAATLQADKLTHSILAKAFRGELVPTEAELARREGREYESASALLARLGRTTVV